jgi:UDP-perosamine 4-acetyltransferase
MTLVENSGQSSVVDSGRVREPLIVVGSGGHAKVVIEVVRATGRFKLLGCIDPHPAVSEVLGVPILGGDEEMPRLYKSGVRHAFIALGANRLRIKLGLTSMDQGFDLPSVVHPSATISPTARIGRGVVVMAGAVINANAVIGDFCIINTLAAIDHDCVLGAGVHVAPRTALAGCVQLGEGVLLGVGAVVIPNIEIGDYAVVGAGGVVVRDLPPGLVAVGVPARPRSHAGK